MYCKDKYRGSINIFFPQEGAARINVSDCRYEVHFPFFKRSGLLAIYCLSAITLSYSQIITPTFSNVDYVGNNHVNQKMDIYIPPGLTSSAPVIVFIHGGGWSGGSKGPENVPFFQPSYESGFICADINYRLSTDSVWPAQIEDCKTAIRFLKENAITFNIDICRFGVIGESAGGHLSSMIGTSAGVKTLEGLHQGYKNQTSIVQAVVVMYAPTDFLKEDGYYPEICGTEGYYHEFMSHETDLLGIDYLHNNTALVNSASPIKYITPDDAHFFIIHGADDCKVPVYQSGLLESALAVAGIPADTFIIAAGQNHGNPYFKKLERTTLYNNFFLKHLSTPCQPVGVSESIFQNLSVFPNPATTEIKIIFPSKVNFKIEIINTSGKLVLKAQNQNIINISGLESGIYFLKLISENGICTNKIMKL